MIRSPNLDIESGLMPRARTGSFWWTGKDQTGDLYARVTWTDSKGKLRERKRKSVSGTKKEARDHIKDLLEEVEDEGDEPLDAPVTTFKQLADYYKKHYAVEAEYDKKGIKKSGMRSWKDARSKADTLVEAFGPSKRIRDFTYGDLARFKAARLRTPATRKRWGEVDGKRTKVTEKWPRSIASVHREIEVLRRMFTIAIQSRWIRRNPFKEGDPLINQEEETKRERIAQRDEEEALLTACDEDKRRHHLKPLLILAFDTGFRPIEMTNLTIQDVDFEDNSIMAVSYKGKRRTVRSFEMTKRLRAEMEKLCEGKKPTAPVFTYTKGKGDKKKTVPIKSAQRSFASPNRLAKLAGIDLKGFRLYDARHTATTRLVRRGLSLEETGKLMGHSQPKTTWRYMHVDKRSRRRAADLLEKPDE